MLWIGWFGFNAGSALAADGRAGMALATTQIAATAGALGWCSVEVLCKHKPSALGLASGAIAGLVGITRRICICTKRVNYRCCYQCDLFCNSN